MDKIALKKRAENFKKGRAKAVEINKKNRQKYLGGLFNKNCHLVNLLENKETAKIALAILYLCEGSIKRRGSLMFGNSSPGITKLFLKLLRFCYITNENKFRCTVQCRADQNIKKLEKFWSKTTKIPYSQFYKAQIDARTMGKKTLKKDYKGVCRIDYFCGDVYNEIAIIGKILTNAKS